MRMAGKAAIITGGGGGIGAAAGALFCREGAAVLLFDSNADLLKETAAQLRAQNAGAKVEVHAGDVSDPTSISKAVDQAVAAFGGLNVLVNNAAVRNLASVEKSDMEEWQRLYSINVLGAVNFCKAALPALRRDGKGSIVNLSSCYAVVGRSGMPIYDATKAALLSLTRSLACEEAENGIRVNAICPGGTLTPYTVGRAVASGRKAEDIPEDERTDSLLRRWAKPEEIAFPILWLASDESSYMTGATIMVDGGLSIM
jgi:meso-butanediol dehydrogenase/(S,S)-butanediol dehydrogenase/diacetyl reductase